MKISIHEKSLNWIRVMTMMTEAEIKTDGRIEIPAEKGPDPMTRITWKMSEMSNMAPGVNLNCSDWKNLSSPMGKLGFLLLFYLLKKLCIIISTYVHLSVEIANTIHIFTNFLQEI